MIRVTPAIAIEEREIGLRFIRAPGPGGQNVNKVASAVQLRFDAAACAQIPPPMFDRLRRAAGRRMTNEGIVVITANRFRSQERNRHDALDRLVALLRAASAPPRRRRATRPSTAAKRRRLDAKRRQGDSKKRRRSVRDDE